MAIAGIGTRPQRLTRTAAPGPSLQRYGWEHLGLRWRRRPIAPVPRGPSEISGPADRRMNRLPPHRNWLAQDAFDLPHELFSRYLDRPSANLIEVITEAVCRLGGDGAAVIRPIGSVAYARLDGELEWDLVRDLDIWVYVSRETLRSAPWAELHQRLQRQVYEVLVERNVFADLSARTGYVYLRDAAGRRRMIELKLADLAWLRTGLRSAADRNPTLVRPGRPAHATKPRLEWSGYVPHENHYPNAAAAEAFDDQVAAIGQAEVIYAQRHVFVENLAEAMRVLGPARLREARHSERSLRRFWHKFNKKQMMLGVLLRDEDRRRRGLAGLLQLRDESTDWSRREQREQVLASMVAELTDLRGTGEEPLWRWIRPAAGLQVGDLAWE